MASLTSFINRKRIIPYVLLLALAGLAFLVWRPVSYLAMGTLEWWYPPAAVPDGDAEAIVVLTGPDADTRYRHAAWLHTHWRALPVLACVGRGTSPAAAEHCSESARRVLAETGVAPTEILIEARSSGTYEDALYAAETLRDRGIRRIALVTDASHMLRAESCFRSQGFQVLPAPSSYRTARFLSSWSDLLPQPASFADTRLAAHEWVGLAWYKVKGYI
jgi:uncharacterized SAM-binding protein YcdF (DUF218 family)